MKANKFKLLDKKLLEEIMETWNDTYPRITNKAFDRMFRKEMLKLIYK